MKNHEHTPRATAPALPSTLPVTLRYRDLAADQMDRANLYLADMHRMAVQLFDKMAQPDFEWASREAGCRILFGWTQDKAQRILEATECRVDLDEVILRGEESV